MIRSEFLVLIRNDGTVGISAACQPASERRLAVTGTGPRNG
jgi:hypothetical protein